jgi:hypothetical protein
MKDRLSPQARIVADAVGEYKDLNISLHQSPGYMDFKSLEWILQDAKSRGKIPEDTKVGSKVDFVDISPELDSIVKGLQEKLDSAGISNEYSKRKRLNGMERLSEEYGTPHFALELNYPTGTIKHQLMKWPLSLAALGLCFVDPFLGVGLAAAIPYMLKKWYDHVYYPKHKEEIKKERMNCADIGYKLVEDLISDLLLIKRLTQTIKIQVFF